MTAMNIVHVRVKPGREEAFIKIHYDLAGEDMPGARAAWLMRTGERS